MEVVILGAGIAGLACADQLQAAGHRVTLFDKGRGPGGRMSTRRVELDGQQLQFDHGAQYFTVRDDRFRRQVQDWHAQGVASPWHEAGPDAWVGTPAMNAPVRHMASAHRVHFGHHVVGLTRSAQGWHVRLQEQQHGPFDAAIIALPAEQAAAILGTHDLMMAADAMAARSQPCWTAMIAFEGRLPIAADSIRQHGIIGWAARDGAKPGRHDGETWVVQGHGSWSTAHLEDAPDTVAQALLAALLAHAEGPVPALRYLAAHRWRFAMTPGVDKGALWNGNLRLGACGDWLNGPRVELAWLSGHRLGTMIGSAAAAA
ncbi:NAD(P)/FAD-dependent oxidoreductase [Sphingomonas azotifigens]|uniref:NAD(P)/FAD-dependent oxidoreductase n=1 Tax=Sphingomonas azotifigens TaxID=330920 RepID=UPI0009FD2D48|nr:FAD-dependent oxidoreductase [Sphingomonas azotifigens]